MTYWSYTERELSQLDLQENELAIYTGTINPRRSGTLSPGVKSKNAYVYIWQNGRPQELDACFRQAGVGLDVLDIQTGEEEYTFLRDELSGYIRQISGPAKPITVANLGAIPLRVDTFLGKFMVYAGVALRLDENAPQREKKKVLLTVSSQFSHPLKVAELWDDTSRQRLNIRREPFADGRGRCFAVLDGSAIVQYLEVNEKQDILVLDSPEPDPDYEMYVASQFGDRVTLRFNRSDYRDGQVVQRSRTIYDSGWGEPVIYDIQKLRESLTQDAVRQCTAEFPEAPDILELPDLTAETRLPDDRIRESAQKRKRPLISDKLTLREILEIEDESGEQSLASEKALIPEPPENFPEQRENRHG